MPASSIAAQAYVRLGPPPLKKTRTRKAFSSLSALLVESLHVQRLYESLHVRRLYKPPHAQ
jgi:hypothetical protein